MCSGLQGFLGKVVSMKDQAIKQPSQRAHVNLLGLSGSVVVRFIYLNVCWAWIDLCMQYLWWPGDVRYHGAGATDSCELPGGCWEQNLHSLQKKKKQVLTSCALSQSMKSLFCF